MPMRRQRGSWRLQVVRNPLTPGSRGRVLCTAHATVNNECIAYEGRSRSEVFGGVAEREADHFKCQTDS